MQSLMSLHLRYYLVKLDRRQEGQERFPIVLPFHLASFILINGPICALHQWSGAGPVQFVMDHNSVSFTTKDSLLLLLLKRRLLLF